MPPFGRKERLHCFVGSALVVVQQPLFGLVPLPVFASGTVSAGTEGWTSITSGTVSTFPTGAMSRAKSKLSFS